MGHRNIDAPAEDSLAYVCSREYEDYLDWMENQGRPSVDFFKPLRLLAGVAGTGALVWAASLLL
jgi:hypothetical protein